MSRLKEIVGNSIITDDEASIEEIRIKRGAGYVIRRRGINTVYDRIITDKAFDDIFFRACEGSYHSQADSISRGFINAGNGLRIGVIGRAVCGGKEIVNVKDVYYLVIRVPHFIRGISGPLISKIKTLERGEGILIYSSPGVGKTTLLRDISVSLASSPLNYRVVLADERNELYLQEMSRCTLISSFLGYPKGQAIEAAVRSSSPDYIISDEIGSLSEADAVCEHIGSGVSFIASAHASSLFEVMGKPSLERLHKAGAFGLYCGVSRNRDNILSFDFKFRTEVHDC